MSDAPATGGRPAIVDAHHHIWRQADLAWLNGPMLPRIFGPYEPIRRDYLATEYVEQATAAGIAQSVYVQANWPLEGSLDEVRWVQSQHDETGWPHAIVGSADLFAPEAIETLEAQLEASPLLRGVRLQLHWHENPQYRYASGPDRMHDPVFRENVARLADLGLLFELQVFAPQFEDAAKLVRDHPDVQFVLIHAGMPEGDLDAWRDALETHLAPLPNLALKLSGQGTFIHRVDPDLIALVARTSLGAFGAGRCMFGSNFPIESLWTDLTTLADAWREVLPEEALSHTARRIYRIEGDS
jgi:predicted TIM-barrel fold metal-dependent hydrolase